MKELRNLTQEEFSKLKENNLLKSIYPEAPDNFEDIKGKRPKLLNDQTFGKLVDLCEAYLNSKEDPEKNRFKDAEHYIFEQAIECVYGESSDIWDYINSFDE